MKTRKSKWMLWAVVLTVTVALLAGCQSATSGQTAQQGEISGSAAGAASSQGESSGTVAGAASSQGESSGMVAGAASSQAESSGATSGQTAQQGKSSGAVASAAGSQGETSGGQSGHISRERAQEIALAHAGVAAADAVFDDKELDDDDGRAIYELEFYANGVEYEYEVDATTGEIRKAEWDTDDDRRDG